MTDPARALAGRREAELLELPSVRRMADSLGRRCREASWIRTLVSALDRFRTIELADGPPPVFNANFWSRSLAGLRLRVAR